jgi:two-component system alkaline phosphatase synthesis response regulator PhoP
MAAVRRALVVEDDADIVELLDHYLRQDGWSVDAVADGREALRRARAGGLDLVLLDLQLPGLDGLSVCRELRASPQTRDVPLIVVTARSDESDRVLGLELGADDYVVKPFSPKELMARVRALRRRLERPPDTSVLRFRALELDLERHTARWGGAEVRLTAKEFALLAALVQAHGRVLSRQHLLETVWGYSYAEGTRTVDVHVRRLREKLPGLADALITVKSIGYRLAAES